MTVSVLLEVAGLGLAGAAAAVAREGSSGEAVVALDAASRFLSGRLAFIAIGVATAVAALAMRNSGLFPRWLHWVGILSGLSLVIGGFASMYG